MIVAVFFLLPPSHRGGDGWLPPIHGVIMVVRDGYLLPPNGFCLDTMCEQLPFLAEATPKRCGAFFFPFQPSFPFELKELKSWVILLLGLCYSPGA
ncbi:hypothetical protein QL285_004393 [Trifolium repens]|jgi:hypothetical protein|nr:hypothetical protein QL285_004393 [Trifolium repens]